MWISVVIPALNEEEPIAQVVREVAATKIPREVIVVDNGSTDQTAERARNAGARVISAVRGYGRACAAGVAAVSGECELIVFLDGDGSDLPEFMFSPRFTSGSISVLELFFSPRARIFSQPAVSMKSISQAKRYFSPSP